MKNVLLPFSRVALLLCFLLAIVGRSNAQTSQPAPSSEPTQAPIIEQERTIMLTEEEYLLLKEKAENPNCPICPVQTQSIIRRGDVRGKKGLVLRVGGGLSYFYGAENDANSTVSSKYSNWYVEGMLGYTLNSDRQGLGTQLGVFANAGNFTQESVDKLLLDGNTGLSTDGIDRDNRYYQGEVGFIFFETLRISTGGGKQEYVNAAGSSEELSYYSTTAGLHFGARYFKVVVDVNMMYGRDMEERVYRPMVGIMFQL